MGSAAEGKHRTALELRRRWHLRKDDEGRDKILRELMELCATEICDGLREGGGILAWSTQEHTTVAIHHVVYEGVQKALYTAADARLIFRDMYKIALLRWHEKPERTKRKFYRNASRSRSTIWCPDCHALGQLRYWTAYLSTREMLSSS